MKPSGLRCGRGPQKTPIKILVDKIGPVIAAHLWLLDCGASEDISGVGLEEKALTERLVGVRRAGDLEDLQRHFPTEGLLLGLVDHAHAAGREPTADLEPTLDYPADEWIVACDLTFAQLVPCARRRFTVACDRRGHDQPSVPTRGR